MCHDLGMKIDFWDGDFRVPARQKITAAEFTAEMDLSSAFAIASVAAVSGTASFAGFPMQTFQPDGEFVRILAAMGVPLHIADGTLRVERAPQLNGVAVNLRNCPDLFPVLAALCALAEGESNLYGAEHLAYKESNRIERMAEMVRVFGREVESMPDGIKIRGAIKSPKEVKPVTMDCDHDHRLAFAAAVFRSAGFAVDIVNPEVVNKSFPEFWGILG
jgi:3-phosphoshikimate 1-carboxyvinyltransferase